MATTSSNSTMSAASAPRSAARAARRAAPGSATRSTGRRAMRASPRRRSMCSRPRRSPNSKRCTARCPAANWSSSRWAGWAGRRCPTPRPPCGALVGFERYQRVSAGTGLHMARTRALPVFGAPAARNATQAVIDAVLAGARPRRDIIADAVQMRAEMTAHKPPAGPLDAKLLPGGLVDLEFAVHMVQLTHLAGFEPHLGLAIDRLVALGLAPPGLRAAYDGLTRLLVSLRLVGPDGRPPAPATCTLVARALGLADWDTVIASFDATRQEVSQYLAAVTASGAAPEGDDHGTG